MSDYIKREDALMAILALEDRDIPEDRYPDTEFAFNEGLVYAANKVNDIPAADVVERKKGKWIRKYGEDCGVHVEWCECSACGQKALAGVCFFDFESVYCPWCGADMTEE